MHWIRGFAFVVATGAATASAAVLYVAPGDNPNFVLASAIAGDTVQFLPGVHVCVLHVMNTHDITIRGKGAIIDARPLGLPGSGPGIDMNNVQNVTIRDLKVRHAKGSPGNPTPGVRIIAGLGVELQNVTVERSDGYGLDALADDLVVTSCRFFGNHGGIRIHGLAPHLDRVVVEGDAENGIDIESVAGAQVTRTSVLQCEGLGIHVEGSTALIDRCRTERAGDIVALFGDHNVVRRNKSRCAGTIGVAQGGDDLLELNQSVDSVHTGLLLGKFAMNCIARKNVVRRARKTGLSISGSGHVIEANTVVDGFDVGILHGASSSLVRKCSVQRNAGDGVNVDIGFNANTFEHNSVCKNGAEGFEIHGSGNGLVGNVVTGNRTDVASTVVLAQDVGNHVGTTGTPQID